MEAQKLGLPASVDPRGRFSGKPQTIKRYFSNLLDLLSERHSSGVRLRQRIFRNWPGIGSTLDAGRK